MMHGQKLKLKQKEYQTRHVVSERPGASRANSIAQLKAQLLARSDGAVRIARVEKLKAQTDANMYVVDCRMLAHTLVQSLLRYGQSDLFELECRKNEAQI